MKSTVLILIQIMAIMRQISGGTLLRNSLAKPPTLIPNICNSEPGWKVIGDPQDCRKFYGCMNNATQHFECAENYYFNSLTMHCSPGDCHRQAIECEAYEILPVANECQKFTFCKQGKRELYQCPINQFFDIEMSVCRPKDNSPDEQCRCNSASNNNVFANPEDCETYYTCSNGKAILIQCPNGEYFDTNINSCLPDLDAICLEKPTMSPPVTPQIYEMCNENVVTGTLFFSSPTDCTTFFICDKGQLIIRDCPEGFYFDDELLYCYAAKNHICKKRLIAGEQNRENLMSGFIQENINVVTFEI